MHDKFMRAALGHFKPNKQVLRFSWEARLSQGRGPASSHLTDKQYHFARANRLGLFPQKRKKSSRPCYIFVPTYYFLPIFARMKRVSYQHKPNHPKIAQMGACMIRESRRRRWPDNLIWTDGTAAQGPHP